MRGQKDEKDFWNGYKDIGINFSSDKSSLNKYSFEEEKLMIENSKRDNI